MNEIAKFVADIVSEVLHLTPDTKVKVEAAAVALAGVVTPVAEAVKAVIAEKKAK
jgi:hypothetical protein